MTPAETYYENLAKTTMKNLEKRHFECHYCKTAEEAVTLASELVPSDSTVSFGGSMTLAESGMADALRQRDDITLLDRSKAGTPEEVKEIYHKSLNADYYFMSSNAITAEGELEHRRHRKPGRRPHVRPCPCHSGCGHEQSNKNRG